MLVFLLGAVVLVALVVRRGLVVEPVVVTVLRVR